MKALLTGLAVFAVLHAQGQLATAKEGKPYSLAADRAIEGAAIKQQRDAILRTTNVESLKLAANSESIAEQFSAVEKLGYAADDEGRRQLETFLLQGSSRDLRLASAKALVVLRSSASKDALVKALADPDRDVRIFSGLALALIGEKTECFKMFAAFYEDKASVPHYSCHQAFLYIGTPDVRPFLVADMANGDPIIAIDAAIVLAQIGYYTEAMQLLLPALQSPGKDIRLAALRGLAYIGDSSAPQAVSTAVNDSDGMVSDRATKILDRYNR